MAAWHNSKFGRLPWVPDAVSGGGAAPVFDTGSVALDGVNDHVTWATQLENFTFTDAFTIAVRFKISSNVTSYIYSRQDATPTGIALAFVADGTSPHVLFQLIHNGSNYCRNDTDANTVPLNTWTSLFVTYDGLNTATSVAVYLDETTPGQTPSKLGSPTSATSTVASYLGRRNSGTLFPFPGWFNNFGIYAKVATLAERTAWHDACEALEDPSAEIASGVAFYNFNADATDSIGTNDGSLADGAFIDTDVG